jgi:hypothetical protein
VSDTEIAAIARRLAVNAAVDAYERKGETKKAFIDALVELCAAVKAERNGEASHDNNSGGVP